MRLSIVIPAYNEAQGVSRTADRLKPVLDALDAAYAVEVVFVDDGSTDDTAAQILHAFAGDARVRLVCHPHNRRLGAALRTGFASASGDVIVTTDFDGTYDFACIPAIVAQLLRDNVDIVTASPYHPQGAVEGVPKARLIFSYGASLLYRMLVAWRIHTWTALFRAYSREVIERVPFASDDFLAGTELLVNAVRAGYRVSEFPTVLRRRAYGQSSMKIARVTLAHLKFQARILTGRAAPRRESVRAPDAPDPDVVERSL
jgi:dolichol-phosphate mannosyltransferase